MNGGRKRWQIEGRPLSSDRVSYERTHYVALEQDSAIRALREEVLKHQKSGKKLVDVRSPEEYSGERLHMPDYPNEGALRGGHIPGAVNVPWAMSVNDDGTFKTAKELTALYVKEAQLKSGIERLVNLSGGRALFVERSDQLDQPFTEILEELSNQYMLGYESTNPKRDGAWREVKIEIPGTDYSVRARQGYRAPGS